MRAIGVRELKERASQVLRRVRERGEEVEVTHHGRVVARLIPVSRQRPSPRANRRLLAERALGGECSARRASRSLMVVDASVVVSRLVPHDVHHEASRRWLT